MPLFNLCFVRTLIPKGLMYHFNSFCIILFEFEAKHDANWLSWRYFNQWKNPTNAKIHTAREPRFPVDNCGIDGVREVLLFTSDIFWTHLINYLNFNYLCHILTGNSTDADFSINKIIYKNYILIKKQIDVVITLLDLRLWRSQRNYSRKVRSRVIIRQLRTALSNARKNVK